MTATFAWRSARPSACCRGAEEESVNCGWCGEEIGADEDANYGQNLEEEDGLPPVRICEGCYDDAMEDARYEH